MATWTTVKQYLESHYTCEPIYDDALKLTFTLEGGRSQVIIVDWAGKDLEHARWVDFHSPLGELGTFNLAQAVQRTRDFVLGESRHSATSRQCVGASRSRTWTRTRSRSRSTCCWVSPISWSRN